MGCVQAVVLGIVQGLGEFLPVSSSGHLILIPWLFGWKDHALSFDVMLHAGTLLAVVVYFGKEWKILLREGLLSIRQKTIKGPPERKLFWYIVIASVPGAIIGKLLEEKAESVFRSPLIVAAAMCGFAIIFYLIDSLSGKKRDLDSLDFKDSVAVGLSQSAAIIPGVSRSGITIACGLMLGLNRQSSARFSFLLSTPIILGATVLKIKDVFIMNAAEFFCVLTGFIVSAAMGFVAISCLMAYVKKHSFIVFVVYRIIFSVIVAGLFFMRR